MSINSINKIDLTQTGLINKNTKITTKDNSFMKYLDNALSKVNDIQSESEYQDKMLATGEIENLHDVTIASNKADIALQLTLTVRNKIIDAYKEIMRMQV
ncbi:flagellar hook-basal body complex protein FliE [Clostridiaceae bacterium M8S5]|nr:flagellar hook-basal body complex protein FliE [Clostridiaceae bacterium M8S5]